MRGRLRGRRLMLIRKGRAMRLPLDVTIQGIGHSDAVEAKIRERAERLDQFSAGISRCEVWVNAPHRHHRKGALYDLRIRLTVPGEEIVIDHQPEREDVFVAIRESFDAARRQLEDYERRRRGWIKKHQAVPPAPETAAPAGGDSPR